MATSPKNYYSAGRIDRYGNPSYTGGWRGWMQYGGKGSIVVTPGTYHTKREALAAIKAQHP
jgi:hypothetical protein